MATGGSELTVVACALGVLLVLLIFHVAIFLHRHSTTHIREWSTRQAIAFVVAHPDDESMFFAPTIVSLQHQECHLLCLSTGNADGLGATRCRELRKTAAFLGFNAHNVVIVDSPAMQDGLSTQWKPAVAARHISNFVSERNIKHVAEQLHVDLSESAPQVFTFDDGGVSGHPNHIAVAKGAVLACDAHPSLVIHRLETTSICRKYIGILDISPSLLSDEVYVADVPWTAFRAMALHQSQFVWYRRLFTVFSRYAYVNTYSCHRQ